VLVVDDEADVRRVIGDAIGDAGCNVLTAADAESALTLLEAGESTSPSSTSTSDAQAVSTSSTPCAGTAAKPTSS